jgi:hypothetical protein
MRTPFLDSSEEVLGRAASSSLFSAVLRRAGDMLDRERQKAADPRQVAALVIRALEARAPRPVYRVANDPLRAALGLLPRRAADALIARFLWPRR